MAAALLRPRSMSSARDILGVPIATKRFVGDYVVHRIVGVIQTMSSPRDILGVPIDTLEPKSLESTREGSISLQSYRSYLTITSVNVSQFFKNLVKWQNF
jgi:hypothetical protein